MAFRRRRSDSTDASSDSSHSSADETEMKQGHYGGRGRANSRPPCGGYDLDLFCNHEIDDYICAICCNVARDCVEVSCGNGHIFCSDCIDYHFQLNGEFCPQDRIRNINVTANDFVKRKILSCDVQCVHHKFGCDWKGALRQLDEHGNECQFIPIKCEYCHDNVGKQNMVQHYDTCQEYLVGCDYCHLKFARKNVIIHSESCMKKPQACPNNCGIEIALNYLEKHLKSECQERMIFCPLSKYGCDSAQMKFKLLNDHLTNSREKHMQLQMGWLINKMENELNDEIYSLKARITQLEAPQLIQVIGCETLPQINGIYKKHIENDQLLQLSKEEQKQEEKKNDEMGAARGQRGRRPFYSKIDKDSKWVLHYHESTHEWIFDRNGLPLSDGIGDGCCQDNALHPNNISHCWKLWNSHESKYIDEESLKIVKYDYLDIVINYHNKHDAIVNKIESGDLMNDVMDEINEEKNRDDGNVANNIINVLNIDWSLNDSDKMKEYESVYKELLVSDNRRYHPFGPFVSKLCHDTIDRHFEKLFDDKLNAKTTFVLNLLCKMITSATNDNSYNNNHNDNNNNGHNRRKSNERFVPSWTLAQFICLSHMFCKIILESYPVPQRLPVEMELLVKDETQFGDFLHFNQNDNSNDNNETDSPSLLDWDFAAANDNEDEQKVDSNRDSSAAANDNNGNIFDSLFSSANDNHHHNNNNNNNDDNNGNHNFDDVNSFFQ